MILEAAYERTTSNLYALSTSTNENNDLFQCSLEELSDKFLKSQSECKDLKRQYSALERAMQTSQLYN